MVIKSDGYIMDDGNPVETKREKFQRLANARTAEVADMLRKIGNLSNKGNYEYTIEDVDVVFDCLQTILDTTRKQFGG